ncbi:MAG: ATP-binding protein [Planctomycetaceae bacterium]|jgi:AAA15 family ATPase/GTPase|nr:ATP-binding protein [Planctomycetaceae bacterium]
MLIEFTIGNFRSFGKPQKFSLVASNYEKNLPENMIECSLPGISGFNYLSTAAVYGANASGKSNLLFAFNTLCKFVKKSFCAAPDSPTCAAPFKLNHAYQSQPTTFEVLFVADTVRYQYNLSLTVERVVEESLTAYPKGRSQKLYLREWNSKTNQYNWSFSNNNSTPKVLLQIAERTRPNVAFLSKSTDDGYLPFKSVYNWFSKTSKMLNITDGLLTPLYTIEKMKTSQDQHEQIISLLKKADFDIVKGQIKEHNISDDEMKKYFPPQIFEKILEQIKNEKQSSLNSVSISFSHLGEKNTDVEMDFEDEESAGTKRYFSLLGPWLDVLNNGYVLFIDELENCLHPLLVIELIKLFRSNYNRKGAQLIFTTHNPILLDETLLRRDQIWFTEKKHDAETCLYPLTDFNPRKGEALVKGYLAGRYGSIPFIPNGLGFNRNE